MLRMGIYDRVHPDDVDRRSDGRIGLDPEAEMVSEKRFVRKDGTVMWAMVVGNLVSDANGVPHHYVCQMVDISDRKRVEARLRIEADLDPLTETLNRRRFSEVLTQAIADAAPNGQLSLLFIDLDNFKLVNDTFGHPIGDELLKAVAYTLRENVRTSDAVGRQGGDEFVVLLDAAADHVARSLADKLAELIAGIGIPAKGEVVRTRASIGVAHIDPATVTTAEDALVLADRAMYAVKMKLPNRPGSRLG
jgi:diguanylate cyclase (GGDEF)-like protein